MTHEIVSVLCGGPGFLPQPSLEYTVPIRFREIDNRDNAMTPCQAYQKALDECRSDILVMAHDDLTINEPSYLKDDMLALFDNPNCAAAGLGGATALGNRDLYRTPYNIWNMARRGYASNQTDAEVHGERFTGVRRVAVLDAFCMAVRVDWLRMRRTMKPCREGVDKHGTMEFEFGWPTSRLTHHCLDLWLACEAARDNKEIWMAGALCTHHGGGTSTKPQYAEAKWLRGGSLEADHQEPHRWLYEEYRDVLPIEVKS